MKYVIPAEVGIQKNQSVLDPGVCRDDGLFLSHSSDETRKIAADMALGLKVGDILALVGDLGAGKTCFVQGLAKGLGVPATVTVSSPTYVLIHEYAQGRLPLYHFDFYRLQKKEETHELNLEEYFEGKGVSVVEWADHFPALFPEKTRWVRFKIVGENEREITVIPAKAGIQKWLDSGFRRSDARD